MKSLLIFFTYARNTGLPALCRRNIVWVLQNGARLARSRSTLWNRKKDRRLECGAPSAALGSRADATRVSRPRPVSVVPAASALLRRWRSTALSLAASVARSARSRLSGCAPPRSPGLLEQARGLWPCQRAAGCEHAVAQVALRRAPSLAAGGALSMRARLSDCVAAGWLVARAHTG